MKAHPVILSCLLTIACQEKIAGRAIYVFERRVSIPLIQVCRALSGRGSKGEYITV